MPSSRLIVLEHSSAAVAHVYSAGQTVAYDISAHDGVAAGGDGDAGHGVLVDFVALKQPRAALAVVHAAAQGVVHLEECWGLRL